MRWVIWIALAMLGVGAEAFAQTRPTLSLLIEEGNEGWRQCGVTEKTFSNPAAAALRRQGIEVVENAMPFLYIQGTILRDDTGKNCIYELNVSVIHFKSPERIGRFLAKGNDTVMLCSQGDLGFVEAAGVARELAEKVGSQIRRCLAELSY
ncbi:MAG: hypothetical protein HZC25_16355 [Rhodospirillales bacterium]|nr:hypothetical protein [Rhodospirillales bacterium]